MSQDPRSIYGSYRVDEAPQKLEEISSIKTHEFRNVRAAARLLYGAFDCGDIDDDTLRDADRKLKELDGRLGTTGASEAGADERSRIDLDQFIAEANRLRVSVFPTPGESLSSILGSGQILLIDDEYERFGWDIVFNAIFGSDRVAYQDRVDEARRYAEAKAESLSLVLLDLGLKDQSGNVSPDVGLKLLKALKKKNIDLPVVVFSGVDETIYTRRCLHAGAFDYYVKETSEKERIQYYLKFKEIVRDAVSHPEWRRIWGKIKRLPEPNEHLLRAYYFLTIDPDDYRIQLMFSQQVRKSGGDPSIHAECVLHCAVAVEDWVNRTVNRHKKRFEKKYAIAGVSVHDLPLRKRGHLNKLTLLRDEGKISDSQRDRINELLDLRISIAHPRRRGAKLTPQDSIKAFEIALEILG